MTDTDVQPITVTTVPASGQSSRLRSYLKALSPARIGVVYVLILVIVIFSIMRPGLFPTWQTARTILNENAVTAIVALALVLPLSSATFDLSIGYTAGVVDVAIGWLLVHTGVPIPIAIIGAMGVALLIGLVNAVIVVALKVDSFIGTLATGAIMAAVIIMVTKSEPITGGRLAGGFANVAQTSIHGVTLPVIYLAVLAVGTWWVQEHTVTGRRLRATGFNQTSARLAGVLTSKLRFGALVFCALVAGFAGIIVASQITAGDPTIGPPYLLPAYAAAFLGATQFRPGRFNAAGTLLAVLLLGTGTQGLGLVGAPSWAPNLFTGAVLLAALVLAGLKVPQRSGGSGSAAVLVRRFRRQGDAADHIV
jgi:ribose/xylose/arabinose/galactoside ABC-type transport system permease subunit